jgi:hypothetical protein
MNIDNIMDHIDKFAWPVCALIGFIVALAMFKRPLASLIANSKFKISTPKGSFEVQNMEQKPPESFPDMSDFENMETTPMLLEIETGFSEVLKKQNHKVENDTSKYLLRNYTAKFIEADFYKIYLYIYGSQTELLRTLNENNTYGLSQDLIDKLYMLTVSYNPSFYKNISIEIYLQFLIQSGLIIFERNMYHITVKGREFLGWSVKTGLSPKDR